MLSPQRRLEPFGHISRVTFSKEVRMTRILGPTGSGRSRRTLLGVFSTVMLLAVIAVPNAVAVHDLGLFELDRNAQDPNFADLPDDWAALYAGGANTGAHSDDFSGVLPDIGAGGGTQFQGGGSKDDLDITSWLWKAGEPLDKDDITNAYAAAYTNPVDTGENDAGDLIIYFGLDRFSTAGSAQVGFWFLQDPTFGLSNTASGGGFEFSGAHVNGDVLVQSNFSNGGVISNLSVFEWQSGVLVPVAGIPTPSDCNPPSGTLTDDAACATVNQSSTGSPWPYTPKANEGPPGTFQTSAFFEGGINISRLIDNAGCFTAFTGETRSSTPFDSRLKDFVVGNLDTCIRDVGVEKTPDDGSANAGDDITFTITVTNLGDTAADNVLLEDLLPNDGLNWSITSDPASACEITGAVGSQQLNCDFGTVPVGETRTVEISSPTDAEDCGLVENTVTVSADGDIDETNNTDDGDITVNCGAIRILKQSTKTGNPLVANPGTAFSVDGPDADTTADFTVIDNDDPSAGTKSDESATVGEICVSGLETGEYTVVETTPPDGYGDGTATDGTATAVIGTDCTEENLPADADSAVFTNPPLGEFIIDYNDLGSGETTADISCTGLTPTPDDATPGAFDDDTETYTDLEPNLTGYVCTIKVDP
jgi:uncharacterized repeat protein (TIGR01451 family)